MISTKKAVNNKVIDCVKSYIFGIDHVAFKIFYLEILKNEFGNQVTILASSRKVTNDEIAEFYNFI